MSQKDIVTAEVLFGRTISLWAFSAIGASAWSMDPLPIAEVTEGPWLVEGDPAEHVGGEAFKAHLGVEHKRIDDGPVQPAPVM